MNSGKFVNKVKILGSFYAVIWCFECLILFVSFRVMTKIVNDVNELYMFHDGIVEYNSRATYDLLRES